MADTNPNIRIPAGVWTDLYAASGIPVGSQLTIENVGDNEVRLAVQATQPARNHNSYNVLTREGDGILTNTEGDLGAWAYCNNVDALVNVTRSKAIAGFYPLQASDFYTGLGAGIKLDATGIQKMSTDYSLFHSYFTFDIPPTKWQIKENGVFVPNSTSTRVVSSDGVASLTSGAVAGNTAALESRRHPRYQPDRGIRFSASIAFTDLNADGILQAGPHIPGENGAYLKTKGDGNLYACILKAGVETHEELITPPFAIDYTKGNIYKIRLLWHGVGAVWFFISNPATGYPQLVHVIRFLDTLGASAYTNNPAMPAGFYLENVTQPVSMWVGSVDISTEGGKENKSEYGSYATKVLAATAPQGLLALRLPDTIGGWTNTRDVRLVRISVTADKKSSVGLYQTRDPAAITGGAWATQIDGSYIEFNTTMTAVNTGLMKIIYPFELQTNVRQSVENPDIAHIDFVLVHGDHLILVLTTGVTVEITASMEVGEEI